MARIEQAMFTNMCMIYDTNGNILVQNRRNPNWAGITFPGGHIKRGESFVESVIREVLEETGLIIQNPTLCGVKQFQDINDARYVVMLFKANTFHGQLKASDEGEVFWIKRSDLEHYQLANRFEEMLEVFEKDNLSEFYYYRTDDGKWNLKLL